MTDGGNRILRAALRALDSLGAVGVRPPEECSPSPRVILTSCSKLGLERLLRVLWVVLCR